MHTELKVKENNIDSSGMEAPAEAEAATATGTTFGSCNVWPWNFWFTCTMWKHWLWFKSRIFIEKGITEFLPQKHCLGRSWYWYPHGHGVKPGANRQNPRLLPTFCSIWLFFYLVRFRKRVSWKGSHFPPFGDVSHMTMSWICPLWPWKSDNGDC